MDRFIDNFDSLADDLKDASPESMKEIYEALGLKYESPEEDS